MAGLAGTALSGSGLSDCGARPAKSSQARRCLEVTGFFSAIFVGGEPSSSDPALLASPELEADVGLASFIAPALAQKFQCFSMYEDC